MSPFHDLAGRREKITIAVQSCPTRKPIWWRLLVLLSGR